MMSLWDYTGKKDENGVGLRVNAYARLRKQPYEKRTLEFNGMEVFLYSKAFLEEFFKVQTIFNS